MKTDCYVLFEREEWSQHPPKGVKVVRNYLDVLAFTSLAKGPGIILSWEIVPLEE